MSIIAADLLESNRGVCRPEKTPIVMVSEHRNRQADRSDGVACARGFNRAEVADGALTS